MVSPDGWVVTPKKLMLLSVTFSWERNAYKENGVLIQNLMLFQKSARSLKTAVSHYHHADSGWYVDLLTVNKFEWNFGTISHFLDDMALSYWFDLVMRGSKHVNEWLRECGILVWFCSVCMVPIGRQSLSVFNAFLTIHAAWVQQNCSRWCYVHMFDKTHNPELHSLHRSVPVKRDSLLCLVPECQTLPESRIFQYALVLSSVHRVSQPA